MVYTTRQNADLDWLLDDLVGRVPAARQAVVLSADGLPLGSSADLSRTDAEHLCALASGFSSLAKGATRHLAGGAVRQTVVEMESAYLFVMAAGRGACLAVVSEADADIGLVAYEMTMLVIRVGDNLSTSDRNASGAVDAD